MSKEEFSYDSAAERRGLDHPSDLPPYDADTELVEFTTMSAERRADSPGDKDEYVLPGRPADAQGYPGGEAPHDGLTAYEATTLGARSTRIDLSTT